MLSNEESFSNMSGYAALQQQFDFKQFTISTSLPIIWTRCFPVIYKRYSLLTKENMSHLVFLLSVFHVHLMLVQNRHPKDSSMIAVDFAV